MKIFRMERRDHRHRIGSLVVVAGKTVDDGAVYEDGFYSLTNVREVERLIIDGTKTLCAANRTGQRRSRMPSSE